MKRTAQQALADEVAEATAALEAANERHNAANANVDAAAKRRNAVREDWNAAVHRLDRAKRALAVLTEGEEVPE